MLEQLANNSLAYHPRYLVCADDDRLLLIAESGSYLLTGSRYVTLHRQLQAGCATDKLAALDASSLATLVTSLEELALLGVIGQAAQSAVEDYYPIDTEGQVHTIKADNAATCLWLARPCADLAAANVALQQLPEDLLVVVVEDWLDPRLKSTVDIAHRQHRNVLIVKYTDQPALGPYFPRHREVDDSEDNTHRCISCFQQRLKANQPWRHWYEQRYGSSYTPVPIKRAQQGIEWLFNAVLRSWKQDPRQLLDAIQMPDDNSTLALLWQRRCVDSDTTAAITDPESVPQHAPIAIRESLTAHRNDGGFRQCPPAVTLRRLQHLINPVTGIISHLQRIDDDTALPVYRSGFFKRQPASLPYDQSSNHVLTLGKGFSDEQSRASATCEALERWAAQWQGWEPALRAAPAELQRRYRLPQQLAPFSDQQYEQFHAQTDSGESPSRQAVRRFLPDMQTEWVSTWSLTESEPVWLPRDFVYARDSVDGLPFCRWNSNGCATGNTIEESILQGLLEVIERDAVAIWWYNQRPAAGIAREQLPHGLSAAIDATLGPLWHYWLLDIGIIDNLPVVVAVARHRDSGEYRMGFGCHVDGELALQRAVTELAQIVAIGSRGPRGFTFSSIQESPFLHPADEARARQWSEPPLSIGRAIDGCLQSLSQEGLEVLVHHYPRELPLEVVKVVVPGACHIWPQLSSPRLLSYSQRGDAVSNTLHLYM